MRQHPRHLDWWSWLWIVASTTSTSLPPTATPSRCWDQPSNPIGTLCSWPASRKNAPPLEPPGHFTKSLRLLHTDHFDLFQLHTVATVEEVEQIFAPGGAMEVLLKARDAGQTRFLGFSAHSEEAALALMDSFDFDTILFPVNFVCWHKGGFGPRVLARAQQEGLGILALKSLARGKLAEGEGERWPKCWYSPFDTPEAITAALRFTLSRPVTAAVLPGHEPLMRWAWDAADAFAPLTATEEEELARHSRGLDPIFPLTET